ncbi:Apolipoprotein N-acyltransferase [Marinobacterium lacunae]|uniref:Apolipoprotein N-acyltransferase n=1 Tax=Marinobacterium lacunae TaxID=1232683 RepID=A0A081G0W4_9GAMM|nr:apolipoprotein N-acyltransferase [Marinobacterium lacunae]KEA64419.1 Apolipoprotein N-acyltransferase [Marinobacterium lacunae]
MRGVLNLTAPALGAVLAGASATLAFAPFSLPLFAILSPALFWLLLRNQPPANALCRGWLFGLGFFGAGVSWVYISIHTYGNASVALAAGLTFAFCAALALLFALQAWIGARWFRGRHAWLAFIALWWLFEWLRSWFLTGFPWLYLGYAWVDTPIKTLAPVGGVWLLSMFSLLLAAGAVEALYRRHYAPILPGSALLLIALMLPGHWTQPAGEPLRTAIVQPNVPQLMKWDPSYLGPILDQLTSLSEQHPDADLIVWPENAVPALYPHIADRLASFQDWLLDTDTTLITGLPTATRDQADPTRTLYHNSLMSIGRRSGLYHKHRLVPFGEYVPLESQLRGLIEFFNLPMSSFSLPQGHQTPLTLDTFSIASAICYEIAYPDLVRSQAQDAALILTVSNDTWFGRSIGPDQHLQMARMRALENGRWVVRGTNNGITAIIDPQGIISAQLPVDETDVLAGDITPMKGQTPYQRLGIWPLLGLNLLLLCLLFLRIGEARKHHRTAATGLNR